MKRFLLFSIIVLSTTLLNAQQDALVSQYMFNGLFINPSLAGTQTSINSTLLHRKQWVDMQGAPQTSLVAIDGPIKRRNIGIGMLLSHDKIGVSSQTDALANYSYKVALKDAVLSFGVRAGISQYNSKVSDLIYWDETDNVFNGENKINWVPKFGFGMFFKTYNSYIGLSIPTLLAYNFNNKFSFDLEKSANLRRHYYLNGGVIIKLNKNVKLKPSFLLKYVNAAPVQADLNLNFLINNMFWIGASYRTNDAMVGILEYQATKNMRVGYAYDYTLSMLNNYSVGSHEIVINYEFKKVKSRRKHFKLF